MFTKDPQKKDGLCPYCVHCSRAKKRKSYLKNRESALACSKKWAQNNKERSAAIKRKYNKSEKGGEAAKRFKAKGVKYVRTEEQKMRAREANKRYRDRNREKINAKARIYNKKRPDISPEKKVLYKQRQYRKLKNTPEKYLAHLLRVRLNKLLRNEIHKKCDVLNYTIEEMKLHIESQFQEGMTWDNYGREGWHIDHIKPVASFDHNIKEQVVECWALSNLRPLWALENLQKGAKV